MDAPGAHEGACRADLAGGLGASQEHPSGQLQDLAAALQQEQEGCMAAEARLDDVSQELLQVRSGVPRLQTRCMHTPPETDSSGFQQSYVFASISVGLAALHPLLAVYAKPVDNEG